MAHRCVAVTLPSGAATLFPDYLTGPDAASLAAAWTLAWAPCLLAPTDGVPRAWSAADPPDGPATLGALTLVPEGLLDGELREWLDGGQGPPGQLVVRLAGRTRAEGIEQLRRVPGLWSPTPFDPEFFALGYAYLQVELLTRSLVAGGPIDPARLAGQVVEAARGAVAGDAERVERGLRACYDLLEQARTHFHPLTPALLDVVLVADTTLGPGLDRELTPATPRTLLLPGRLAEALCQTPGRGSEAARSRAAGLLGVACGGQSGLPPATLDPEAMLRDLAASHACVARLLGGAPTVYASHHGGLPPRLPRVLEDLGFANALLTAFDGTPTPRFEDHRLTWEGPCGARVEALATPPHNAADAGVLAGLGPLLAGALGRDPTGAVVLARWAGQTNEPLEDLRLVAKRSDALGGFQSLEQYFAQTTSLRHSLRATPASSLAQAPRGAPLRETYDLARAGAARLAARLHGLELPAAESAGPLDIWRRLLPSAPAPGGVLALNGWSFDREVFLASGGAIHTPGLGYRVAPPTTGAALPAARHTPDGPILENGRLTARLSPATGGLAALCRHERRGVLASLRPVAFDSGQGGGPLRRVEVESMEANVPSSGAATAVTVAVVLDGAGRPLVRCRLTYRLAAGSETLSIGASFEDARPTVDASTPRVGLELAWADAEAAIDFGAQWARFPGAPVELTGADYVHVAQRPAALTLAPQGGWRLRRCGPARLFAQPLAGLEPGPEGFRLDLAVGSPYPLRVALCGGVELPDAPRPVPLADGLAEGAGWVACVEAGNLLVTHVEARADRSAVLRVMETEGRPGAARLRLARPLVAAWRTTLAGVRIGGPLSVVDGAAELSVDPHGWIGVEASW